MTSAVRVTPDGREEPVRGVMLEQRHIHDVPRHRCRVSRADADDDRLAERRGGGTTLVSVIAPSLIFEELDIQRNKEPLQKKPLVPSPIGR